MQILTKFIFVLLMLVTVTVANAQTNLRRPDVIQKMDKTSIEAVIDEINKTDILYRKPSDPKGPLYAIPKKDVNKIIWNNGDIEEVNPLPVVAQNAGKPTGLLVKPAKPRVLFGDQKGIYAGLKAGAGVGMVSSPKETILASEPQLAYNGGVMIGYRTPSVGLQLEALYTRFSYGFNNNIEGVKDFSGQQANLILPLTATLYKRLGKLKLGATVGGYGSLQIGTGSTKVNYSDKPANNVRNCSACGDSFTYGVMGGLAATIVEGRNHAIFLDARWYQSLVNNSEYNHVAESGVKMNTGIISAGVLFNLSHD